MKKLVSLLLLAVLSTTPLLQAGVRLKPLNLSRKQTFQPMPKQQVDVVPKAEPEAAGPSQEAAPAEQEEKDARPRLIRVLDELLDIMRRSIPRRRRRGKTFYGYVSVHDRLKRSFPELAVELKEAEEDLSRRLLNTIDDVAKDIEGQFPPDEELPLKRTRPGRLRIQHLDGIKKVLESLRKRLEDLLEPHEDKRPHKQAPFLRKLLRELEAIDSFILDLALLPPRSTSEELRQLWAARIKPQIKKKFQYARTHPVSFAVSTTAAAATLATAYMKFRESWRQDLWSRRQKVLRVKKGISEDIGQISKVLRGHYGFKDIREWMANTSKDIGERRTWDMVIGLDEAKKTLQGFVAKIGTRDEELIPRGILLYGPPGVGKTFLVSALANEASLNVVEGRGFTDATSVINFVTYQLPSDRVIVFLDEFEKYSTEVQNEFLTRIGDQGIKGDSAKLIIYIAAVNRLSLLEEAMYRRFDAKIELKLPETPQRIKLLEIDLERRSKSHRFRIEDAIDSEFKEQIAKLMNFFNASNIAALVKDASRTATDVTPRVLTKSMVLKSVKKMINEKILVNKALQSPSQGRPQPSEDDLETLREHAQAFEENLRQVEEMLANLENREPTPEPRPVPEQEDDPYGLL